MQVKGRGSGRNVDDSSSPFPSQNGRTLRKRRCALQLKTRIPCGKKNNEKKENLDSNSGRHEEESVFL